MSSGKEINELIIGEVGRYCICRYCGTMIQPDQDLPILECSQCTHPFRHNLPKKFAFVQVKMGRSQYYEPKRGWIRTGWLTKAALLGGF